MEAKALNELSPASQFALLPEVEQKAFWETLTEEEALQLHYTWEGWWARPKQILPEGHWLYIALAGRGWGKTVLATQHLLKLVQSGEHDWIAFVGMDYEAIRKTNIEGPSGFKRNCPPWLTYKYAGSPKPEIRFSNGVRVTCYSAEDPESLRGFTGTAAICDEFAAWRYVKETWDMLMFGLREGANPSVLITTTPKPLKLLRQLVAEPKAYVVRGHTDENANINAERVQKLIDDYGQSNLGRQELAGEILDDNSGLFKGKIIDANRITFRAADGNVAEQRQAFIDTMEEVVIAIDPSIKRNAESDECGLLVCGKKKIEGKEHFYVIEDASGKMSPKEWGDRAVKLYGKYASASTWIVVETNQGGQMAIDTLTNVWEAVPYKEISATKSKQARAEPISVLMDQGRIHHISGFTELEEELTGWEPGKGLPSPNRLDAYVYALLQLSGGGIGWWADPSTWEFLGGMNG